MVAIGVAVVIFISSLDDLFIDIAYWVRRVWRAFTVYARHAPLNYKTLYDAEEKPLAIMVPAWQEHGVIGQMAQLAATTLDYENYHIFIGTYPNDPQTHADVEQVRARFPNVHTVVCARPGPTSKADCLNNVVDAILQFEKRSGVRFAGFILHDAEDVLSKLELRLFNYLVNRKDLIQLPVYPLERPWNDFTGGHYLDEFAELHGKDIVVREALVGQVPSAGVGTCFSRRAIMALLQQGDGIAFDTQSLTEDYDIGFRLKQLGMQEVFVRFPVEEDDHIGRAPSPERVPLRSEREASVISVREFFPDTVAAAVRQKSRWITGIVIQGFRTLRWTHSAVLNYFLWRDRKQGNHHQFRQLHGHAAGHAADRHLALPASGAGCLPVPLGLRGRLVVPCAALGQPGAHVQPHRAARVLRHQLLRRGAGIAVGASAAVGQLHQLPCRLAGAGPGMACQGPAAHGLGQDGPRVSPLGRRAASASRTGADPGPPRRPDRSATA
ncbi:glycosyltransferase family 2 protein [Diaphorobacter sp. JS3050]|uniref:glycosyltransferase family 2 protein n=1 Tax=Diaphorobacter sp. JS3050 TaxID=2735554 RepID=UPI0020A6D032|nr:glycosyltransferase family 2 protein [Diaphorobacter sp. JS3050]